MPGEDTGQEGGLVLVFHGVDGIGYEALPHELLNTYFSYIQNRQEDLWVATFSDVAKYMRERMASTFSTTEDNDTIVINIKDSLDKKVYDVPLTLKSYIPSQWKQVLLHGSKSRVLQPIKDEKGSYVTFDAVRSNETIKLTGN